MVKIYFCGSIRGGRGMARTYDKLITMLQDFGEVLTEHIGEDNVIMSESESHSDEHIYSRDMSWLAESDVVIAEVTTPSLGVGYELGYAVEVNKPVLCLYREGAERRLSAMITGCPDLTIVKYKEVEELATPIGKFIAALPSG